MSLLAGRRQRPFRPGHESLLPPTVYELVLEALCICLASTVVKRRGKCWVQAKREGRLPQHPTATLPATDERQTEYTLRWWRGECLHHPDDARYAPYQGRRGVKWADAVLRVRVVDQRAAAPNGAGGNGNR
jgi:hypothetical protein